VGFGWRWPGVVAVRLHAAACLGDGGERSGESAQTMGQLQQTTGEDGLKRADGVGAVGLVRGLIRRLGRRYLGKQGVPIVSKNLGREVLLEDQMGQTGGGLPGAADA